MNEVKDVGTGDGLRKSISVDRVGKKGACG